MIGLDGGVVSATEGSFDGEGDLYMEGVYGARGKAGKDAPRLTEAVALRLYDP